jgi:hypothetical protein
VWHRAGAAGRVALTASAVGGRVAERGLVAAGVNAYGPVQVRTGDLVASYTRTAGAVEIGAWLGARGYAPRGLRALPPDDADSTYPGAPLRARAVAAMAVTAWIAPAVGVTASAGTLPNDPVRGLPAARHVLIALRVRPWTRLVPAVVRATPRPAGAAGPELRVDAAPADGGAAGARVVQVTAPGAARVQLRADATGWRPVELARTADGVWTAALPLASGTHRVLVRVDAGPWRPPANLPAVDDDLGARVGLLVVP